MKKLIAISDKESLEIIKALGISLDQLSKTLHEPHPGYMWSEETKLELLDRLDLVESIQKKFMRLF